MTGLVLVSRLTGFIRTWAQAFTLGATMLASCYTVANNLPNLLYEITIGGMIAAAFLPVYLDAKKRAGRQGASEYASNMVGIILVLMGIITVASFMFASPLIWTQSAGADATFSYETATLFFRCFCIEVLLYPLSALLSALLNAERKYFWSNAAPIFNNIIVIASFIGGYYAAFSNPTLGFIIYAVGNPLGVFVQMAIQIPAMRKAGIVIKPKIDIHDPSITETVRLGVPMLLNAFCAAIMASVQSSMSLYANDAGAAILYYVRVWFVLPSSLFAVPVQTAMFTELSALFSNGNMDGFKLGTIKGARQVLFTQIPFGIYLAAFSPFLMSFFAAGNFGVEYFDDSVVTLIFMGLGLPFYSMCSYLGIVCAACHRLKPFSMCYVVSTVISCFFCIALANTGGLIAVAFSITIFNFCMTCWTLWRLHRKFGHIGIGEMIRHSIVLLICTLPATFIGILISYFVVPALGPIEACYSIIQSFGAIFTGGLVALVITYWLASVFHIPEAEMVRDGIAKLKGKLKSKKVAEE